MLRGMLPRDEFEMARQDGKLDEYFAQHLAVGVLAITLFNRDQEWVEDQLGRASLVSDFYITLNQLNLRAGELVREGYQHFRESRRGTRH